MNYKKIIVFILAITLLSSLSFAEELYIKDSASGVDFQLYLTDNGDLYGIGSNEQGELGLEDPEYDELKKITDGVLVPVAGDSKIKRTVASGADFSVIVKTDKKAYATGENYFGQLATEDNNAKKEFTEMKGDTENTNIVSVSAGADFVLLLNEEGAVYGAGDNGFGQIKANGEASYNVLTQVYNPAENNNKEAKAIATGSRHSVILIEDGTVITLGDNEYHQRDITVPAGKKVKEIAAGSYHTLIILNDNSVWGVGNNENQQIAAHVGGGSILDQYRSTMVQLLDEDGKSIKIHNPDARIRNVSAGFDFSIVITKGKDDKLTVVGIGNKYKDQLGKEAKTKGGNAIKIETIDTIENINANWQHSIIMGKDKDKNKTESKGNKFYGEVGLGKPIKEQGVKSIAMGAGHSLYVKDNVLYGAGANTYGQLGLETYSSSVRKVPFNVEAVGGIKQIATGAAHSIILGFDGSVWGAGYNYSGQLGLGDNNDRKTFTKINYSFDSPVIAVAAGGDVTMILTQNGTVYAMGDNTYKQINIAAVAPKTYNLPTIYSENQKVTEIGAGIRYTIVLRADGRVEARGENVSTFDGTTNVEKIAAGAYHTLLLLNDGSVQAYGRNQHGQLGINSISASIVNDTVSFTGGIKVKDMVAGYTHSLFLTNDGIYIAGNISGSTDVETNKLTPTKYADVIDAKEIAIGWFGNIVKTATSIVTVGNNVYGQRGSHRGEESSGYDEEIASLSKKKIAAGYGYTMVLHSDGTLWGIGENTNGQLGTGDNVDRSIFTKINTPVPVGDIVDIQVFYECTVILTREGEIYITGNLFGSVFNKFTKYEFDNVKRMFFGDSNIFVIKNDGSLWGFGSIRMTEGSNVETWLDDFTKIELELNNGEFIKNVIQNYYDTEVITNERKIVLNGGASLVGDDNISKLAGFGTIKLQDDKIYKNNNEMHMVTTEGTNDIINNNSSAAGSSFSEKIVSIAVSDTHIVVLTESGQLYAAGDNTNGILGNDTLNENNVTRTEVFVPMHIQSIAPTVGVVVK